MPFLTRNKLTAWLMFAGPKLQSTLHDRPIDAPTRLISISPFLIFDRVKFVMEVKRKIFWLGDV